MIALLLAASCLQPSPPWCLVRAAGEDGRPLPRAVVHLLASPFLRAQSGAVPYGILRRRIETNARGTARLVLPPGPWCLWAEARRDGRRFTCPVQALAPFQAVRLVLRPAKARRLRLIGAQPWRAAAGPGARLAFAAGVPADTGPRAWGRPHPIATLPFPEGRGALMVPALPPGPFEVALLDRAGDYVVAAAASEDAPGRWRVEYAPPRSVRLRLEDERHRPLAGVPVLLRPADDGLPFERRLVSGPHGELRFLVPRATPATRHPPLLVIALPPGRLGCQALVERIPAGARGRVLTLGRPHPEPEWIVRGLVPGDRVFLRGEFAHANPRGLRRVLVVPVPVLAGGRLAAPQPGPHFSLWRFVLARNGRLVPLFELRADSFVRRCSVDLAQLRRVPLRLRRSDGLPPRNTRLALYSAGPSEPFVFVPRTARDRAELLLPPPARGLWNETEAARAGAWFVLAWSPGEAAGWRRLDPTDPTRTEPVVLALEPFVRLAGRILDPRGRPAAGVEIRAVGYASERLAQREPILFRLLREAAVQRARSDAQGNFFFSLPPRLYGVRLSAYARRGGRALAAFADIRREDFEKPQSLRLAPR